MNIVTTINLIEVINEKADVGVREDYHKYTRKFENVDPSQRGVKAFDGEYLETNDVSKDGHYLVVFRANYKGTKTDAVIITVSGQTATIEAQVDYVENNRWSEALIKNLQA